MEFVFLLLIGVVVYLVWANSSRNLGTVMHGRMAADTETIRQQVKQCLQASSGGMAKKDIFRTLAPSNLKAKYNVIKTFQVMVLNKEVIQTETERYRLNE